MITSKQYEELCVMIANYRDAIDALHTAAPKDKVPAAYQFGEYDRDLFAYVRGLTEPVADSDGWVEWSGGMRPVAKDAVVDLKFGDGMVYKLTRAGSWTWAEHHMKKYNIVAYRVVSE